MNIEITGAKPNQRKYITSIVEFCIKKMMPRMTNIEIQIKLKSLKGDVYGYCMADPEGEAKRGDRPRVFELEISKTLTLRKLLETIAHEMVHVKQYAQGELYEGNCNKHRWQGKWLSKDPSYWDQPREIEAHGREHGLFIQWTETNKLAHRKWTQV